MDLENIKLVVLGDDGVGKTSILMSYKDNKFPLIAPIVVDNDVMNVCEIFLKGLEITIILLN